MKELFWVGTALRDLRAFPEDARRDAGHQLHLVQLGVEPHDWKPMASVGPGVRELRIRTGLEHRVFYVAKFDEGIYVLHAFQKKSQKTARRDIECARNRYRALLSQRKAVRRSSRR